MANANERANMVVDTIEAVILAYRCGERADADSEMLSLAVQHSTRASTLTHGLCAEAFLAEYDATVAAQMAGR